MTPPIIKISAYKAWKEKPGCKPYDTDFYTEMDRIKSGHYKPIVDQYRLLSNPDEKARYKVSNLPSLTISAVCKDWRKLQNVVNHTGLLNLDIDGKSNPQVEDWPSVRDQIFNMKGVVACFLSVSGNGVTFVVRVDPQQHKDTFFSIVDGMKQHFNINVDAALHDVVRLRFVSDDPGAKIRYNYDEIPISYPSASYLENKKNFGGQVSTLEPIGDADSEYNYNEAVKRAEADYVFDVGKWNFLVSVAGCCNVMGMSLQYAEAMTIKVFAPRTDISQAKLIKPIRDTYKTYKSQHGTYTSEAKNSRLNEEIKWHLVKEWLHKGERPEKDQVTEICKTLNVNHERVEVMINRVFSEYAEEFGYKDFPSIRKVEIWLSKRWSFAFNKVTCQPEMADLGTKEPLQVNCDELFRQLQSSGFKYPLANVKSLMKSEFAKAYDPIFDYFKSLQYDSSKDYIHELSTYISTEEGQFWNDMFKKCCVRSIACGLGKSENRIVMVLYGKKQETGKSTFIRFLSPWPDGKYFTESPIIGGNQKDTEIRFSENFIYNMEELAGLSRVDVSKLKADISKASIKERRPYASFETSAPRRCNLWASTNQKEFLHDDENTRWLIFDVNNIDWSYKQHIDINKVWAQAWHLYKNGFDYSLSDMDRAMREHLNDEYRYRRPEEELIARHFKPAEPGSGQFYSATEIAIKLNAESASLRINSNNIGKTMSAVYNLDSTVVRINGRNTRGYWLYNGRTEADGEKPQGFISMGPLF